MARRVSPLLFACFASFACGQAVEGEYSGEGTGFLEKIDFKDDERVELTFMGMTREGTYEIEDDKVKINSGGEISILRIDDDGCLVGGGILGKYCKRDGDGDGDDVADDGADESPEGSRWVLRMGGEEMVIEFTSDDRGHIVTNGDAEEFKYEADGDEIRVFGPEGDLVFTRRGDTLEGGAQGVTLTFRREG